MAAHISGPLVRLCVLVSLMNVTLAQDPEGGAKDNGVTDVDPTKEAGQPANFTKHHNVNIQTFTLPPSTTRRRLTRTTPRRISFSENCDYLAHYCLRAYLTGKVCGRTLYFTYYTFKNYCLLDYVNCMERYDVWQVLHMGACFQVEELDDYVKYPYDDDYFLDQYYVLEDH